MGEVLPPHGEGTYLKVFHAIYEDPTFAGTSATWDEIAGPSEDATWREAFGTEAPGVLQRTSTIGVDVSGMRRVRWAELFADRSLASNTDWQTLGDLLDGPSWPRSMVGPQEGSLDVLSARSIAEVIVEGATPDCVMFRHGWTASGPLTNVREEVGAVATGAASDFLDFMQAVGGSPHYCWATDSTWSVTTDLDACTSFMVLPDRIAGRMLGHPALEAIEVSRDDRAFPMLRLR
ncbi:MAG: hypothetical protein KY462_16725 [Actinobacteria bacterium]|nr:hypothetical protein [Actinomycetota bacterium]